MGADFESCQMARDGEYGQGGEGFVVLELQIGKVE